MVRKIMENPIQNKINQTITYFKDRHGMEIFKKYPLADVFVRRSFKYLSFNLKVALVDAIRFDLYRTFRRVVPRRVKRFYNK
jgi:hypothetical protein